MLLFYHSFHFTQSWVVSLQQVRGWISCSNTLQRWKALAQSLIGPSCTCCHAFRQLWLVLIGYHRVKYLFIFSLADITPLLWVLLMALWPYCLTGNHSRRPPSAAVVIQYMQMLGPASCQEALPPYCPLFSGPKGLFALCWRVTPAVFLLCLPVFG